MPPFFFHFLSVFPIVVNHITRFAQMAAQRRNAASSISMHEITEAQSNISPAPVDSTAKAFLPFRSQACCYRLSTGGRDTRAIIDLRDANLLFSMMGDCFHLFHSFALCPHGTRGHCAADRGPDSDHTPLKTLLFFTWRS